jgi:hypothetical protein
LNVQLVSAGPKKIQVIKVVRELTNWGLREAKDWVDSAPASALEVAPEQADAVAAALRGAGATVVVAGGTSQHPGAAAVATEGSPPGVAEELEQLASLHDRGVLSDEEFAAAKARLLGISPTT